MKQINTTLLIDKFSKKFDDREGTFFLSQKFHSYFYTIFLNYNLDCLRISPDFNLSCIKLKIFCKNDENKSFYFNVFANLKTQNRYLLQEKMGRLQKQSNQVSYFKENILLLESEQDCFNFFIKEINDLNLNSKKILLLEKTIFNYEK